MQIFRNLYKKWGRPYNNFSCHKFPIKKKFTEAKILPAKNFWIKFKKCKNFSALKNLHKNICQIFPADILNPKKTRIFMFPRLFSMIGLLQRPLIFFYLGFLWNLAFTISNPSVLMLNWLLSSLIQCAL